MSIFPSMLCCIQAFLEREKKSIKLSCHTHFPKMKINDKKQSKFQFVSCSMLKKMLTRTPLTAEDIWFLWDLYLQFIPRINIWEIYIESIFKMFVRAFLRIEVKGLSWLNFEILALKLLRFWL